MPHRTPPIPIMEEWMAKCVERTGKRFDATLLANLYPFFVGAKYKDYSPFIVIDGNERLGKSTLAAQVASTLDENFNLEKDNLDFQDFVNSIDNGQVGEAIVFDEATTGLFSRQAMTKINATLVKTFMVSGAKNLITIVCIPNFFMIDRYIRDHRIDALIHIPKRGRYWYYNEKKAKDLSKKGYKYMNHTAVFPNFKGYYNKKFPENFPYEPYRKKKIFYIDGMLKSLRESINNDKEDLNIQKMIRASALAKQIGMPLSTMQRKLSLGEYKGNKKGRIWYITEEEVKRIIGTDDE